MIIVGLKSVVRTFVKEEEIMDGCVPISLYRCLRLNGLVEGKQD